MNVLETGLVLERLSVAYNREIPEEALELWSTHLASVDPEVAIDAVENVIGTEQFFPTIALFQKEVAAVLRDRTKSAERERLVTTGPDRSCPTCAGMKWYETDPHPVVDKQSGQIVGYNEQWKPCSKCAPVEFSRWLEYKEERVAEERWKRHDHDTDVSFKTSLAEARARLEEKD